MQQFEVTDESEVLFEFTPNYSELDVAADRIRNNFPDARRIFVVREPIHRIQSEFYYNRQRAMEDAEALEAALTRGHFKERYFNRTRYYTMVKRFYNRFPKEQLLVLVYGDMVREPEKHLKLIYEHIGLKPQNITVIDKHINASTDTVAVKFLLFNKMVMFIRKNSHNPVIAALRHLLRPLKVSYAIKQLLKMNTKKVPRKKVEKEPALEKCRELIKQELSEEINEFKHLTGINPVLWKEFRN